MVLFNEADMMEFAEGRVANVLGPRFAPIDLLPRRVRLPGPPFLAVSRVLKLSGGFGRLKGACIRTEFDIPNPDWSAVDGQASALSLDPQGVQFLAAWLGIDFENLGQRHYRWVEGRLTYLGGMPLAGQCVEYDIRIIQSLRVEGATLFRAECLATVDDQPVLRTDRCTIGFFTAEALARGTEIQQYTRTMGNPPVLRLRLPLDPPTRALERVELVGLASGDIANVMSSAHASGGRNPSLRLPPPIVQFIDRVIRIEDRGGTRGLGRSEAELRIDPQHWAVRAHFKDDSVFPGPCMLEGATQLLQVHALALGLQAAVTGARFQPILNLPILARFRAQVVPRNQTLSYRADIVDIGLSPEPYVIADVDLIEDSRVVGRIEGLGVRMVSQPSS